ncbi:hypothetical protein ACH4OY_24855 [Micromonospora rubida]|uniref:Uncharacterized protein n=1 Tax=Micromonospora rubida TaxID=2697657 RepID=A0ABW7STQ8_9ACTN
MGALGVDSEVKVVAGGGRGTEGWLDLARWDDTAIEIGEIKPGHPTCLPQGRDDLDFYKGVLEETEDPRFKLPEPQLLTTTNVDGVYGYKCTPPDSDYFIAGGRSRPATNTSRRRCSRPSRTFFGSECIRKKTKRQATREERVRITDRARTSHPSRG